MSLLVAIPAIVASPHVKGPHIDWRGLSPIVALSAGALLALLAGCCGRASFATASCRC